MLKVGLDYCENLESQGCVCQAIAKADLFFVFQRFHYKRAAAVLIIFFLVTAVAATSVRIFDDLLLQGSLCGERAA